MWIRCAANGKYLSVSARNKVRAAALDNTHARAQWVVLDVIGADGRHGVALRSRLTGQLIRLPAHALDPQLLGTNDTSAQTSTDLAWELNLQRPSRLIALSPGKRGEACLYHDATQPSPALDLQLQRPCEVPPRGTKAPPQRAASRVQDEVPDEVPASHRFEVGRVAPGPASPLAELRGPVRAAPSSAP